MVIVDPPEQRDDNRNAANIEEIQRQVKAVKQKELEHIAATAEEKQSTVGGPEDPRFVLQCLADKERGDGVLYAAMHRGKFINNKSRKDKAWLKFAGHHWKYDLMDESVYGVEDVALRYLQIAEPIRAEIAELTEKRDKAAAVAERCKANNDNPGKLHAEIEEKNYQIQIDRHTRLRSSLSKRADQLRSKTRAEKCLWWAHNIKNPLAIVGDEIDKKETLLACPNGIVNLQTGSLQNGKPEDYLVRAVPTDFPTGPEVDHYLATGEGFKGENWQRFISEIHEDDQERVAALHRTLGYSISGLRSEHFIACFIGEGANGKGTLFETLHDVLGELAWSIEPEMLMDQKNAKAAGSASAEIVSLHGRRLVVASETEENRRISASKVKRLTGGDTLTGRSPHDKYEINFRPTHKLMLYTNHPPKGLASDFAMFRRLLYFSYPLRYVDNPEQHGKDDPQNANVYRQKDPALPDKLKKEAPWILTWLVRGFLLWQAEGGIKPPDQLRAAAEAIRREEDHVGRFIEDCCERCDENQRVALKSLYAAFKRWYEENIDEKGRHAPNLKKVSGQLRRKGYNVPSAKTTGGTTYVYGLYTRALLE